MVMQNGKGTHNKPVTHAPVCGRPQRTTLSYNYILRFSLAFVKWCGTVSFATENGVAALIRGCPVVTPARG